MQILPIENIEGRKAVEKGNSCLRKTFSGVDLNRNWATEWRNVVSSCSTCDDSTAEILIALLLPCCNVLLQYLATKPGCHL